MSFVWMSRVTHMNKSHHTQDKPRGARKHYRRASLIWRSHLTHTFKWVLSHSRQRYAKHYRRTCHVWMSQVTFTWMSHVTYTWMSHVTLNSDPEAIRKHYRRIVLSLHPDKNSHVRYAAVRCSVVTVCCSVLCVYTYTPIHMCVLQFINV